MSEIKIITSGFGLQWRAKVMRGPHHVRTFYGLTEAGATRTASRYINRRYAQ